MPRQPRFNLAGVPQHIIQRGNNRQRTFFADDDYRRYLDYLASAARAHSCAVHAYALLPNHVHLLVTPGVAGAASKLMQSLSGRYVQYVNAAHGRSGTLWEGRYRACIVETERYLMTCHRYIELNPVRAGLVRRPADYPWSSFRHNGAGAPSGFVVQHALYRALGASPGERRAAYGALFQSPMEDGELRRIRTALNQERALAGRSFGDTMGARLSRSLGPARRGRPKQTPQPTSTPTKE